MRTIPGSPHRAWHQGRFLRQISNIALTALLSACASTAKTDTDTSEANSKIFPLLGVSNQHKSIFVFLDGTLNDQNSETNVWRLYSLITMNNDPQTTGVYIEGVGTVDNPVFGSALGKGMEKRILKGYEFIAENYLPGDDLYIVGFSRGAHEARSLAGLLAYAGVPTLSVKNRSELSAVGNRILDFAKDKSDEDSAYRKAWASWTPGQSPVLAEEIKDKFQQDMLPVEVKFLGVWDTVPGSSFKKYNGCKEQIGFWKTWFYWLPMIGRGERYKTDSYPAIHYIAHAVSLDEKRSKFEPILLCPPINDKFTKTIEVWFPGAHADVGGGYADSHELPDISLGWMLDRLAENYIFNFTLQNIEGSARGLAHWSIGDFPANIGSECVDRKPLPAATPHPSVDERKQLSLAPLRIKGVIKRLRYPLNCADL